MSTTQEISQRRERFFAKVRQQISTVVNPDGSGKIPQFNPPWREPIWILPALYTGDQASIDLANRMVARYNAPESCNTPDLFPNIYIEPRTGREYNIFQSNTLAHCLHRFHKLLTPGAEAVMRAHAEMVVRTQYGAGQSDYKFHGANDNFPMMATCGLLFAGDFLGDKAAVEHATWNLNQYRRLLSRSAWASEFNSSTYSPLTLSNAARIATYAPCPKLRETALGIEHRLWTELLLHYHAGTFRQSGPQCRAYAIDLAGHNHSLQLLFWLAFGEELVGRNVPESYFNPDPREVMHFAGTPFSSIAEYCDFMDTEYHLPDNWEQLLLRKKYPVVSRGRSEVMGSFDGQSSQYRTYSYMEEEYSLGSVSRPMCGGEQTASPYITYQLKKDPQTFRDSASAWLRYVIDESVPGQMESSPDGVHANEQFIKNHGWIYCLQEKNTVLAHATPNLSEAPLKTGTLKLCLLIGAHFGGIRANMIGDGKRCEGAVGESAQVAPVSIEAGEARIHVWPLLPTNLPRSCALRWQSNDRYQWLELINYEGPEREFTREELAAVLNGMVLTVCPRSAHATLEEFHATFSKALITDYYSQSHRFTLVQRDDLELELVLTPDHFGVQTECVNGRHVENPVFASNQLDPSTLPFMSGEVERNRPFFRWPTLDVPPWPNWWMIGSRGLPTEANYSHRTQSEAKK